MGWPTKWVITHPSRSSHTGSSKLDELKIPFKDLTPKSFKTTDQYCPLWKFVVNPGKDSANVRLYEEKNPSDAAMITYQSLFLKTDVVEPKIFKFDIIAHMNGYSGSYPRKTTIPVEVEIKGC
jgi:hypothetical protein